MAHGIRLADLRALAVPEREEVMREIVAEGYGPLNGIAAGVIARIRLFEERYEMTSTELLGRLASGQQIETDEIAEWLFLIELQEQVHGGRTEARP